MNFSFGYKNGKLFFFNCVFTPLEVDLVLGTAKRCGKKSSLGSLLLKLKTKSPKGEKSEKKTTFELSILVEKWLNIFILKMNARKTRNNSFPGIIKVFAIKNSLFSESQNWKTRLKSRKKVKKINLNLKMSQKLKEKSILKRACSRHRRYFFSVIYIKMRKDNFFKLFRVRFEKSPRWTI